ncbi:hypothetical protein ACRAWD_23230 [Caulobacter segnis]
MAMTIAIAGPAMAQTAATSAPPAQDDKAKADSSEVSEIVVTGTLLRGVAPVGTNVIGVGKDEVIASGAANTNDLLATIPQVSNFNGFPAVSASFGQPIAQTNLRGLGALGRHHDPGAPERPSRGRRRHPADLCRPDRDPAGHHRARWRSFRTAARRSMARTPSAGSSISSPASVSRAPRCRASTASPTAITPSIPT